MPIKKNCFATSTIALASIISMLSFAHAGYSRFPGKQHSLDNSRQTGLISRDSNLIAVIGWIGDILDGRPPSNGNRDSYLCVLSPDPTHEADYRISFSRQPVFAWDTSNSSVSEIRIVDEQDNSIWIHNLSDEEKSRKYVFYSGSVLLEERQNYYVSYYNEGQDRISKEVSFKVLPESHEQYQRLLEQFGGDPNLRATTEEEAQQYAQVFIDESLENNTSSEHTNLWMDAMRQVLSVPEVSSEFLQGLSLEARCNDPNSENH